MERKEDTKVAKTEHADKGRNKINCNELKKNYFINHDTKICKRNFQANKNINAVVYLVNMINTKIHVEISR